MRTQSGFSFVSALVVVIAVLGCGGDDKGKLALGLGCTLNSDCSDPLLCKFSKCHKACNQSKDCEAGARCVKADGVGVCQFTEARSCATGCAAPLTCGPDSQCRTPCTADTDCAGGQACVPNGVMPTKICADHTEPLGAAYAPVGDGGAPDAPMVPPVTPDAGAGTPDAPVVTPPTPDAGGGLPDAPPASTCGAKDQACCASKTCSAGLSCVEGKCACGIANSACCGGTMCGENLTCTKAAAKCSCVRSCGGVFASRNDGAIVWDGNNYLKTMEGMIFRADGALDIAAGWNQDYAAATGCVVKKDGTVWCWGSNQYGALGAGIMDATSAFPRQVILSSRAPLTGITKLATNAGGNTFCATGEGGKVWCWGYGNLGLLGTGFNTNSDVAVPALASAGGEQVSGVVELSVAERVAYTKADGTLWTWGSFYEAMRFPRKVEILDTAASVACSPNICCAVGTKEGNVWCFDDAAATKLAFAGGAPVAGVTTLMPGSNNYIFALKSDLTTLGWNSFKTVVPLQINNIAITAPHVFGEGCLVSSEGSHIAQAHTWAPFCE